MITLRGKWQITVTEREAAWDQRVVIHGSANADGAHPGIVGTSFEADGDSPWSLTIEHNDGSGWAESLTDRTMIAVSGTDIHFAVLSEDIVTQPGGDYNDLVLEVRKVGPIIEIPIRPYAVRTDTFQMMPDGIFETFLGRYYMGVRVKNIWGLDFPADQMLDITQQSRNILASQGIQVLDSWEASELASLGQTMIGRRIVIGPLKQFETRTVFFKVDCTNAKPDKYNVQFESLRPTMPDPLSPNRKAVRKIYVSRSHYDALTKEMVSECPEGTLRLKLRKVLIDQTSARRALRRIIRARRKPPIVQDELNRLMKMAQTGKEVDLCRLLNLLRCACECSEVCEPQPGHPRRFTLDDFFLWPLEFSYTIEMPPFRGTYSPLPYQDPWWKVFLLLLALVLWIASLVSDAEDMAYHDDDIVIGTLERWQREDVDAAVCLLNGNRDLPSDTPFHYLDAQSGEVSTMPLDALDSEIAIDGQTLTNADIDALIAAGDIDGLRVFKSGSRTGLTHARILGLTGPYTRSQDGTAFNLPQLHIVPDPDHIMGISNKGDSGSVWIHRNTRRIVGLNHSGNGTDTAIASRIEDVMNRLNIRFI